MASEFGRVATQKQSSRKLWKNLFLQNYCSTALKLQPSAFSLIYVEMASEFGRVATVREVFGGRDLLKWLPNSEG
jgi:hypothetical protein